MNRTEKPHFEQIVTIASRMPRAEEIRGVTYHFVGERAFLRMLRDHDFLEAINYGENEGKPDWKGTLKGSILKALENKNMIWRIDMGAASEVQEILRKKLSSEDYQRVKEKVLVVLVGVESLFDLRKRVKDRDGDDYDREKFLDRLRADWKVWQESQFEHVVVNREGDVEEAVTQVVDWVSGKDEGVLLVLAGPTGVGKDTIMRELLESR